jgi:Cu+-exporting ATPase
MLVRDPVCGASVEPSAEAWRTDHLGERFYFCSEACKATFEADPDRYAPRGRRQSVG